MGVRGQSDLFSLSVRERRLSMICLFPESLQTRVDGILQYLIEKLLQSASPIVLEQTRACSSMS